MVDQLPVKKTKTFYLACIDRFSKNPNVEVFDKTNESNSIKFLEEYIEIHGVPRNIRLYRARKIIGKKIEKKIVNKIILKKL